MRIIRIVEHAGFSKTIVGGEAIEKTDWTNRLGYVICIYIYIYNWDGFYSSTNLKMT
jgi:hypothetical protein